MTEDRFAKKHAETWKRLDSLLAGLTRPGFNSIAEFERLYRIASSHLAYAQTNFPNSDVCLYLNGLVSRAHTRFYAGKRAELWSAARFYTRELPALLRRNLPLIVISALLVIIPAVYSGLYSFLDPALAGVFIDPATLGGINTSGGPNSWDSPVMSSVIMTNNIRVALMAASLGAAACAGTAAILVYNGLFLGAVSGYVLSFGNAAGYWSLILPHGVLELTAIFISGAAGLRIGYSLINPGRYKRLSALRLSAAEALKLMGAAAPMLVIAGIIEGFFTPLDIDPYVKLMFAAATGIITAGYFLIGRKPA